jgi:hypothetical protein
LSEVGPNESGKNKKAEATLAQQPCLTFDTGTKRSKEVHINERTLGLYNVETVNE